MSLGDVVAFIQYSRQFTFPIIQVASIVNVLQSAVASAERVFELLDEPEEIADPAEPVRLRRARGAVAFEDVSFRYDPERPLIDGLSTWTSRPDGRSPSSGRPAPARRPWSTCSCASTSSTTDASRSTASTPGR